MKQSFYFFCVVCIGFCRQSYANPTEDFYAFIKEAIVAQYSDQELRENMDQWHFWQKLDLTDILASGGRPLNVDNQVTWPKIAIDLYYFIPYVQSTTEEVGQNMVVHAVFSSDTYLAKSFYTTLCPKEVERCLPSSFSLQFFPKDQQVVVEVQPEQFLLYYDYDKQEHLPFSHAHIEQLNTLVNAELTNKQSPLHHLIQHQEVFDDVDGVSGATVTSGFKQYIPQGGMWTVLTVFDASLQLLTLANSIIMDQVLASIPEQKYPVLLKH